MILIILLVLGMIASFIGYLHVNGARDNDIIINAWLIFALVYVCNIILRFAHIRG